MKGIKMFGKVKKVFFTGMFGLLYISFIAQIVYVLGWVRGLNNLFICLAALSVEWLVLIAARYLSKRASGNGQHFNGGFNRRR